MFGLITQKKYDVLYKEHEALKTRIKLLEQLSLTNRNLKQEIHSLQGQLAEVKKQIREQTEADLFFISAKIQKKLLDGEPKANVQEPVLQQLAYQNQLALMQSPYSTSFLGGLGLGALPFSKI